MSRVICRLDNYYNYEFRGYQNEFYCIHISDDDGAVLTGYIRKDSKDGKAMFRSLESGENYAMMLILAQIGPNGEPMQESAAKGECVTILQMLGSTWIYSPAGKTSR